MHKQALWTQEFVGMSFSSFFQYMTHYALIAALPVFVMDKLNGNAWQAGLAMTFFQVGAVLCRPFAGKWIDEFDKNRMLWVSLGLFLLISILYLGAGSLYFLLAIRLLHGGIFATGTTIVAAMAALVLPADRKGEGIGYFAVFTNLAMVIGPFFSLTMIYYYQFDWLFAGCAALALLAFWCGNRKKLPAAVSKAHGKASAVWQWSSFVELKALPMAFLGGLLFFAYTGVLVFIPLYAKHLGLSGYTSVFFAVFALVIIVSRPVVGRLFDRLGANVVVYPGFMMFIAGLIWLSQVKTLPEFLAAAGVIGIGFGALSPVFQILAMGMAPGSRAGVATATYFLALDISVGLGSFFLSVVSDFAGYSLMYLFAAAVTAITAVVYSLLGGQKRLGKG